VYRDTDGDENGEQGMTAPISPYCRSSLMMDQDAKIDTPITTAV
jgi:hypothetical protein